MSLGLDDRIKRLAEQLDKAKAQQKIREQAAKNRQASKERKDRDRRIYKLGGMIEKMGLDRVDEVALLGGLALLNKNFSRPDFYNKLSADGRSFLDVGNRLPKASPPEKLPESAQQEPGSPQ